MWLQTLLPLAALLAAVPPAGVGPASTADPQPIYTRQTLFGIPFRMERPDRVDRESVVQLFVSGDRGAHWDLYRRLEPAQKHFLFRAGCDGEYWFLVRTRDRSGKLYPDGPHRPEMKVIVDTTAPKLQLSARRGEGGQIVVRWQAEELFPKLDSLTIQYRTGPTAPWQPVAVARQNIRGTGPAYSDEVMFWPPAGATRLQIRAEMTDQARNLAVSHTQVVLDDPRPAGGQPSTPLAGGDPKAADSWRPANPDPPPARWPAENDPANARPGPVPGGAAPGGLIAQVSRPIGSPYSPGATPANDPPPGEPVRTVPSKVFEVTYSTESVGPSGVSRAELWGTRDGGRTWRCYATEEKRRGTITANVDQDGTYGFRIVLTNGAGLGERPPQSGDPPKFWIKVDCSTRSEDARPLGRSQGGPAERNVLW